MSRHPYDVLVGPLLTERATSGQGNREPKYAFRVRRDSSNIEIRRAIETAFKVRVVRVNTVLNKGKQKRLRMGQPMGRRPDWKKAIVTLAEGDSINLI